VRIPIPILCVSPIESFSDSLLYILIDIWDLRHDMNCLRHQRYHFVHSAPDLYSRHCYFHVYSLDLIRLVGIQYLGCFKLHLCTLDDILHNTAGNDCDTHLQDCNRFVRLHIHVHTQLCNIHCTSNNIVDLQMLEERLTPKLDLEHLILLIYSSMSPLIPS
jgi:hypothetical protein